MKATILEHSSETSSFELLYDARSRDNIICDMT